LPRLTSRQATALNLPPSVSPSESSGLLAAALVAVAGGERVCAAGFAAASRVAVSGDVCLLTPEMPLIVIPHFVYGLSHLSIGATGKIA
jgi:hypothetical protein